MASALSVIALGVGMYALNGDVVASAEDAGNAVALTINGETTEYATYTEVLEAANQAESAKITLLKDTQGSLDWIYTDLTLDLAGYTLSNACCPLARGGNAGLTVEDSSEAKTGYVDTIDRIVFSTVEESEIVINGGRFDDLSIAATSGTVTLIVNDGYFEFSSINLRGEGVTGSATINGGSFEWLYAQHGTQSITLNQGVKIKNVYGFDEDFLVSQILAEDCILLSEEGRGINADVSTVRLDTWATVTYHPTCEYNVYESDENEHWLTCICGKADEELVKEAHKGGTTEYGEQYHWTLCVCEVKKDYVEHTFSEWTVTKELTATEKGEKTRSCECGYTETEEIDVLPPATENTSETENEGGGKNKDKGCGSVVSGGTAAVTLALSAAAVALLRKKREE